MEFKDVALNDQSYFAEVEESHVGLIIGPGGEVTEILPPIPFIRVRFSGFPNIFSEMDIRNFFLRYGNIARLKCKEAVGGVCGTLEYTTIEGTQSSFRSSKFIRCQRSCVCCLTLQFP